MNETLKQIGMELKRFFSGEVRRPLNWRMIDAMETLRGAEPKEDETNAEIELGARLEDDELDAKDIAFPSDSGRRTWQLPTASRDVRFWPIADSGSALSPI